jgi:hypothetical protein
VIWALAVGCAPIPYEVVPESRLTTMSPLEMIGWGPETALVLDGATLKLLDVTTPVNPVIQDVSDPVVLGLHVDADWVWLGLEGGSLGRLPVDDLFAPVEVLWTQPDADLRYLAVQGDRVWTSEDYGPLSQRSLSDGSVVTDWGDDLNRYPVEGISLIGEQLLVEADGVWVYSTDPVAPMLRLGTHDGTHALQDPVDDWVWIQDGADAAAYALGPGTADRMASLPGCDSALDRVGDVVYCGLTAWDLSYAEPALILTYPSPWSRQVVALDSWVLHAGDNGVDVYPRE